MPNIKNLLGIFASFSISKWSQIFFKPRYFSSQSKNESVKQMFEGYEQSNSQKQSYLGKGKIDPLTNQALIQYESKIRKIREEHSLILDKIAATYNPNLKSLQQKREFLVQNLQNDQFQQSNNELKQIEDCIQEIKTKKLEQILNNQTVLNSKLAKISNEYNIKFYQARKKYEQQYIKKYILENYQQTKEISEVQKLLSIKVNDKQSSYIPNNLVMKKLIFKTTDGKNRLILLTGIQQNDEEHAAYIKILIQKFKIKHALTLIPPDMPYFIKSQSSFRAQWARFLKMPTSQTKFYLNPSAKTLNDITLQRSHIPYVLSGMTKSKSFYRTAFSLMQMNEASERYQHQPLYSGLVSQATESVYFCDYPFLKERQMIALSMKLSDLRQLIKRYAIYKQVKKQHFSAELLLPKNIVQKKFKYIIKMAKTIALSTQSSPILICNASIAEVLAEQWKKSPLQFLQFDHTQNSYLLDMGKYKIPEKQVLFIEFIEKLVILDIILKPLISDYFIKYESFPYNCKNTVGGKQNLTKVFLLWKHFYNIYISNVKGKKNDGLKLN